MTDDDPDDALCVYIDNQDSRCQPNKKVLEQKLRFLMNRLGIHHGELSLSFVPSADIQKLNLSYRNKNKPTDVLSFPQQTFQKLPIPREISYPQAAVASSLTPPISLGDIIICPEIALKQAVTIGHSFSSEVDFLCIHSLLHLCGYNHEKKEDETIMLSHQRLMVELLNNYAKDLPSSIHWAADL